MLGSMVLSKKLYGDWLKNGCSLAEFLGDKGEDSAVISFDHSEVVDGAGIP